eukprot:1008641-Rhodomonas_salina.1
MDSSSRTRYLHQRIFERTRAKAAPLLKVIVTVMPAPRCSVSPPACAAAAPVGARTRRAESLSKVSDDERLAASSRAGDDEAEGVGAATAGGLEHVPTVFEDDGVCSCLQIVECGWCLRQRLGGRSL